MSWWSHTACGARIHWIKSLVTGYWGCLTYTGYLWYRCFLTCDFLTSWWKNSTLNFVIFSDEWCAISYAGRILGSGSKLSSPQLRPWSYKSTDYALQQWFSIQFWNSWNLLMCIVLCCQKLSVIFFPLVDVVLCILPFHCVCVFWYSINCIRYHWILKR